jgi:hypothetical protein
MNKGFLILLIFLAIFSSCTKKTNPPEGTGNKVELTTDSIISISQNSAVGGGKVLLDGGSAVTARGVVWSSTTSQFPTTLNFKTIDGSGTGEYSSTLSPLIANTTYYVRAYASNSVSTFYGDLQTFKTPAVQLPTLTTTSVTSITNISAISGGDITSAGGGSITIRGVCWSTNANPTTANSKTSNGSGIGAFVSSITGISPGITYYVRAYATNTAGTSYGNQLTFTSLATVPTLTTNGISSVSSSTANSGGNIISDGGSTVTVRGVCWSTTINPTTANSRTIDGSGTGTFVSSITGLSAGVTYYVRAYATNSSGTAYGNQLTFTSLATIPTLSTNTITGISQNNATSGGSISSSGGSTVTVRGVCWSTAINPTTANSRTIDGSGTGTFVSSITGLSAGITYYVRAYATNSSGTAYGNQQIFTTLITLPSVTTTTITSITSSSARSGGNVTSIGGGAVTSRGVCWNTIPNPTIANFTTINGPGVGSFLSTLTGLSSGRTYYVKAYATNAGGTSYGTERTFTTN